MPDFRELSAVSLLVAAVFLIFGLPLVTAVVAMARPDDRPAVRA